MTPDPARSRKADILFDAFYGAAVGGATVAGFFLLLDLIRGEPLLTPSILGYALFTGEPQTGAVSLEMVALFTGVHFALFGLLGLAASALLHRMDHLADRAGLVALGLFGTLQFGVALLDVFVAPGLMLALGVLAVTFANGVTAVSMSWFLRRSHRMCVHGEKGVFSFGRTPLESPAG